LNEESFEEHCKGNIDLEKEWQIGVIVGKSGTGKSTIAKELFSEYFFAPSYKSKCVIDDFPKMDSTELFNALSSVGFSSPPSWLKPYSVLSNGEKMRVDLARAICEKKEIICFDEFTSVVDREVAQLGSFALQKAIRRSDKKFIAVTCHCDIIDWLEPDWIFNTDSMEYQYTRGSVRRPKINLEVYEARGFWEIFRRYHYLNHDLNNSAKQYVGFIGDKPVAFIAYRTMPHPKGVIKMVHRLVALPDYQGLGIGSKMLNLTAQSIDRRFPRIHIITSLKSFGKSLMKNRDWRCIRVGRIAKNSSTNKNFQQLNRTISAGRNTYSFCYVGKRN
jgi:GNAT superfamily N-acetyltransferase